MPALEPVAPVAVSNQYSKVFNKQHVNVVHSAPAAQAALARTTAVPLLRNSI